MTRVLIAGGGLAGLAAAIRLSAADTAALPMRIMLIEAAPRLGGRAWSFSHPFSAGAVDNGQHVLMGCYRDTLAYLAETGGERLLTRRRGLALPFVRDGGGRGVLQAGRLPHPLSLLQAFLRYRLLSPRARLRVLRVALRLRTMDAPSLAALDVFTADVWLRSLGQDTDAIRNFWEPVVLATMNTVPAQASAKLLAVVLREIFLRDAAAADMLLPEAGLSEIFVEDARALLEARGIEIRMRSRVERLLLRDGAVVGIALADGAEISSDMLICTVPPWALQRIVARTIEHDPESAAWLPAVSFERFRPSPILSIHAWLGRRLEAGPMTGLLGTTIQWVFDRGDDAAGGRHYSCTVSAAGKDIEEMEEGGLRALLLRELRLLEPELEDADILRVLPVREARATFLPLPGMEAVRPQCRCGTAGLMLAGDWTATGLPATIEGAVRSGFTAADAILSDGAERGRGMHPTAH